MISKFLKALSLFERVLAVLSLGVMTLLMIVDVGVREILNQGFPIAQKLALFLMIWAGFLGSILTAEKGAHLRPEMAKKFWPKNGKRTIQRISDFVVFFFCLLMSYAAWVYVKESFEFSDRDVVSGLPLWFIQLILPYVFISIGIRHISFVIYPDLLPPATSPFEQRTDS
jgi:TRAP-type C4-dicarboxylate transport system permease small subunit